MTLPVAAMIDALNGDATMAAAITGGIWLGVAPMVGDAPVGVVRLQSAPPYASVYEDEGPRAWRFQILLEAPSADVAKLDAAVARLDALFGRHGTRPSLGGFVVSTSWIDDVAVNALVDGQTRYLQYGLTVVLVAE